MSTQQQNESSQENHSPNPKDRRESPADPVIILCRPQLGENIGTAARAMLNFGLTDLRLVAPRDGWPNERAKSAACGALENMAHLQIYDTLEEAIADLHFTLATTGRRRDMVKPEHTPLEAMEDVKNRSAKGQKTGIVFGAERTGLTNEDLSLCQAILTFPTNPDFTSINLAQSVLLTAYEWQKIRNTQSAISPSNSDIPSPALQEELTGFLDRLEKDLEERLFFRTPEMKPTMTNNIRNIFTRSDITEQELRTLHGILSALRGNKTKKN